MGLLTKLFRKTPNDDGTAEKAVDATRNHPTIASGSDEEKALYRAYDAARSETERHFVRNDLISLFYKQREDPIYVELCRQYCFEDVNMLSALDEEAREYEERTWANSVAYGLANKQDRIRHEEAMRRGFVGRIPAFDRLTMLYAADNDYARAIAWCDRAIARYEAQNVDCEAMRKRRERFMKKFNSAT